jgi:hypothetical protein
MSTATAANGRIARTQPSAYSAPGNDDPYAPTREDERRAEHMKRAWDAYDGVFQGGSPQWPLLWQAGREANPNVVPNLCGPIADADVAWLMGQKVTIEAKKIAGTDRKLPTEAQTYLDAVWGVSSEDSSDDDKMALLQELATNGAICGTAFLKINATVDLNTGTLLDPEDYPELVVLDSRHVRVRTDPHNVKLVVCYIIEYPMPDPQRPQDPAGMFRQVIELVDPDGKVTMDGGCVGDDDATWQITDYFRAHNSNTFVQTSDQPDVWPFGWAPIDGCPHLLRACRYYGRPRITPDVIHLNEVIALISSNINKVIISHAHPVLYTVTPGSNLQSLRYEPGTIMQVSADIKAVQAHGDIANMLAVEHTRRGDLDQVSHVPGQLFGRQDSIPRAQISGVAIRLGNGPMLSDITKEQRTYGALIRRVSQRLLSLQNPDWAHAAIMLGWQDPLPADDLQQAQVIQTLIAAGVMSKRSGATNVGLDWDDEQENMAEEGQQSVAGLAHGSVVPQPPQLPGQQMPGMPPSTPQPGQPPRQRPGQSPMQQPGNTPPSGS